MERYIIKLSYPSDQTGPIIENTAVARIKITKETRAIYGAVSWFEDRLFPEIKSRLSKHFVKKRVRLRSVLNIHNSEGIRDIKQIKRMIRSIGRGLDTLARSGMPNVKLFRTRKNKLFLFDGHHSMLAYMASGRKHLDTIPHLLIERNNNGRIDDADIYNFFGGLLSTEKDVNWFKYAINWQAPKTARLCARQEKNMGELYDTVSCIMN
ncbi:hypothetical protein K8R32_01110 [bacterium]|nr:hypothetical protein [bacterium]